MWEGKQILRLSLENKAVIRAEMEKDFETYRNSSAKNKHFIIINTLMSF